MNFETLSNGLVRLVGLKSTSCEGEVISQLEASSRLPDIQTIVGFPDLHPGKGIAVGAAYVTKRRVYPHLVGNDIGCGMAFWKLDVAVHKLRLSRLEERIEGMESAASPEELLELRIRGLEPSSCDAALGTIGGGNHFAELQGIEEVCDERSAAALGLERGMAYLLVHSGSRSMGEMVYQAHVRQFGARGVVGEDLQPYLRCHDHAVAWARANREMIARRLARFVRADLIRVLDSPHNFVAKEEYGWVHRKGVASSRTAPLIIPGSRGTLSYLVEPTGEQTSNVHSISHGAGRKWRRSECQARLAPKFKRTELQRTVLGGRVICEDNGLLYEEAPEAYKRIEGVIEALQDAGLIRVVASLRPLLTYKVRRS